MAGIGKQSVMYSTMHRQPADLERVLTEGSAAARTVAETVAGARATHLVGIGTSYHAALFGAWVLRSVGIDARPLSSFDYAHYPEQHNVRSGDAVIVLSHSGAKQFSLASLKHAQAAGARVFSVGGLTAEHPGSELILRTTEREQSAAFTSSHTTAMAVLAQVAAEVADIASLGHAGSFKTALLALPQQIQAVLRNEDELQELAALSHPSHSYIVGGGPSEVTALEAVIKGREAAYVRIDGMGLEQFIHGPMICLQPEDVVVLVNVAGSSQPRNREAVTLFRTLGASVWTIGERIDEVPGFEVPSTDEVLSPILTTVAVQLWAWWMATLQDIDPDTFRRQEPRFAEGVGGLQL